MDHLYDSYVSWRLNLFGSNYDDCFGSKSVVQWKHGQNLSFQSDISGNISYDLNATSLEWWFVGVIIIITGWCFGTWILFSHIGNNHPNWLSYFSRWLKPPTRLFQVCEFIHWPAFFFYDWWFIPGLTTWWPVLRSLEYLDLQMIFYKFSMGNPLQYRESIGNIFCFLVVPQANPWIGISFNTPARAATEW